MGLSGSVKAWLIRRELKSLPNQKELDKMAEEVVAKKGMPPWVANLLAGLGGLIVASVQDVATGGNFADLLSNPKALVAAVLSACMIRWAHSLRPPVKPEVVTK